MLAGACGAAVGSPADLILVRMQADGRLPVEKRVYNYTSVFNGLARVVKNESVLDLWRGSGPTVIRAMLVTASQLSVYDVLKTAVVGGGYLKDGTPAHLACSFVAGFVAAVATNPVDVVKTRLMNQSKASSGAGVYYNGMLHCFGATLKSEGVAGLYKVRLLFGSSLLSHLLIRFLLLSPGICSQFHAPWPADYFHVPVLRAVREGIRLLEAIIMYSLRFCNMSQISMKRGQSAFLGHWLGSFGYAC